MKVFYHNDNDGKCSAAIVYNIESRNVDDVMDIRCIPIQYGDNFPHHTIHGHGAFKRIEAETVYILDFSIETDDMAKLLGITENVIWIDHHKTAIEKYSDFAWRNRKEEWCNLEDIIGIREVGISGCELTWRYFNFLDAGSSPIPEAVKLIGDRDIWAYKYGDRTRDFYYGLKGLDLNPARVIWNDIFTKPGDFVNRGETIRHAFEEEANDIVRTNGFWVDDFHGYRCYAANYFRGSEPFEAVEPDADVYLAFSYEGKNKCWTVSLYSTKPDIDVSEIAKQYEWKGKRGGGHKGAAGFQCDYPPFLSLPGMLRS